MMTICLCIPSKEGESRIYEGKFKERFANTEMEKRCFERGSQSVFTWDQLNECLINLIELTATSNTCANGFITLMHRWDIRLAF